MVLKLCLACGAISTGPTAPHRRHGSTRHWRALRAEVIIRDGRRCQLCGAPATDVDHVIPVSQGGADDPTNLRALCAHCNRSSAV